MNIRQKILVGVVLNILILSICSSCGGRKKEEPSEYHPCFSPEALGVEPNYGNDGYQREQSEAGESDNSGPYNRLSTTMSGAEDAYEEGRALREEDRLNGTRQHEGDNYDDDNDDDYDEGYEDE